jgi:hypothetical protein
MYLIKILELKEQKIRGRKKKQEKKEKTEKKHVTVKNKV